MPRVSLQQAARGCQTVVVPSRSDASHVHNLRLMAGVWTCDCKGFTYQGKCWASAEKQLAWDEAGDD